MTARRKLEGLRRTVVVVFGVAILGVCIPRAAASADALAERHVFDDRELRSMAVREPEAQSLLLEGERALRTGTPERAALLFQRASELAPARALVARRLCQSLTLLGQRDGALAACNRALLLGHNAPDFRAAVAALMSAPPSPDELARAWALAALATTQEPRQPWGAAARGDIALRIGSTTMLEQALTDLQNVAKNHYETQHLRSRVPTGLGAKVIAIWVALVALVALTLGHAAHRRFRLSPLRRLAVGLSGLGLMGLASPALAAPGAPPSAAGGRISDRAIDPEHPEASAPTVAERNANPLTFGYYLMDLNALIDEAAGKREFTQGARYAEALIQAVPEAATGHRLACQLWDAAGKLDTALPHCRAAVGAEGVQIGDYLHYAELLTRDGRALSAPELDDLTEMVTTLTAEPGGEVAAAGVECQLAVATSHRARLEHCTSVLERALPNDSKTIGYGWTLAMQRGDLVRAKALVDRAKKTAIVPGAIDTMQRGIDGEQHRRRLRGALIAGAGALALGLLLLFGRELAALLRRARRGGRPSSASAS